jgi:hypothetical protein
MEAFDIAERPFQGDGFASRNGLGVRDLEKVLSRALAFAGLPGQAPPGGMCESGQCH